jgi:hypothetical protein
MNEFIKDRIVGTWKLVSWIYQDENGKPVHYFGENATGILMYDRSGYMNAQLMKPGRNSFASDSIDGGTREETYRAFCSYLAYFGRYYEERPGEIVHIVEGSLFPNWLERKEIRYGKIMNDNLVLYTPAIPVNDREIVFYITWERVPGC